MLIKEVYKKFHDHILNKFKVQGDVELILSEDGSSIIGIKVNWDEMSGKKEKTFMLCDLKFEVLNEKENSKKETTNSANT